MKGIVTDIEKITERNTTFRTVLYTGKHSQLVAMMIPPAGEIGMETHPDNDQFFRIEEGMCRVSIDGNEYEARSGFAVIVPAGAKHNIINTSDTKPLRVYTVYSPPHHKDGVIHATRDDALRDDEEFDGKTTE